MELVERVRRGWEVLVLSARLSFAESKIKNTSDPVLLYRQSPKSLDEMAQMYEHCANLCAEVAVACLYNGGFRHKEAFLRYLSRLAKYELSIRSLQTVSEHLRTGKAPTFAFSYGSPAAPALGVSQQR